MTHQRSLQPLSWLERLLSFFCPLGPREGHSACILGISGFFLMLSYYLVRPVREALVLSQASAEMRAYAVGAIAVFVLLVLPAYGKLLGGKPVHRIFQRTLLASTIVLVAFALGGMIGLPIQFPFFVWLGIFSLLIVAQFWTIVANTYGVESGQRVLPAVAIGLSAGALAGSRLAGITYELIGPYGLMIGSAAVLLLHYRVQERIIRGICPGRNALEFVPASTVRDRGSYGFELILRSPYLLKIAILVTILNWIDTAGDFVLARAVQEYVSSAATTILDVTQISARIGSIYAEFFFWICVAGLALQLLAVSRIFRSGGVGAALLVLPLVLTMGYAVFGFMPVFSTIYVLKILEASIDYSVQGTAKHALFLPLNPVVTCHAKMTVDTFFWRFGDLINAIVIGLGINFFGFDTAHFVAINVGLSAICVALALSIGADYRTMACPDSQSATSERRDLSLAGPARLGAGRASSASAGILGRHATESDSGLG